MDSDFSKLNPIFLIGEIDSIIINKTLKELKKTDGEVDLIISSVGGCCSSGKCFIDSVNHFFSDKIRSVSASGVCASMGGDIWLSFPKNIRYVFKGTEFLFHKSHDFVSGNSAELEESKKFLERADKETEKLLKRESNLSVKKVKEVIESDKWRNINWLIKVGLVNKKNVI